MLLLQTWTSLRWFSQRMSTSTVRHHTSRGHSAGHHGRKVDPWLLAEQGVKLEEFFESVRGKLKTPQVQAWMKVLEAQRVSPTFQPPPRAPSHAVMRQAQHRGRPALVVASLAFLAGAIVGAVVSRRF